MAHEPQQWLENQRQLAYTREFGEVTSDSDRLAAEEAIAAQLFFRFLEFSLVGHARYAYSCALEHFPLPEAPSGADSTNVVIALVECFCRWHDSVKQETHPTKGETTAVSKELLSLALFFLHPTWVMEVAASSEEENAPLQPASLQSEQLLKLTPKTVGVQVIHAHVLEVFKVIDQHEDPDALFKFRVVLPDAEYVYQVYPLASGLLRVFDFPSLGITLLVMSEAGQGGRAFAMKCVVTFPYSPRSEGGP